MRPGPLLLSTLMVVGPGLGASLALYGPGEIGLPTRVALVFVLGTLLPALIGFVLAILQVLSPLTLFALLSVATVFAWYLALKGDRAREHLRMVKAEIRDDPWTLSCGLLVVAGIVAVQLTVSPLLNLSATASWRYWADAVQIAESGQISHQVLQYGTVVPAVINKVLLSSLGSGVAYIVGHDPFQGMAVLVFLSTVGLAAALWALGRELGLRFTAALMPPLIMANRLFFNMEITTDLKTLKAELFGRAVAFCALALGVRSLREGRRKDVVVGGVLLGLAAGIHPVPVLIVLLVLGTYTVGRALVDRGVIALGTRLASIVGIAALIGAVVLFLPRGDVALKGAAAAGATETFDPTRFLNSGKIVPLDDSRRWYIPPGKVLSTYVRSAVGLSPYSVPPRWMTFGVPIAVLLAALAMLLWFPRNLRPIGIAAWSVGAAIVVLTWFLSLRSRLYIPAYFGIRRLYDYSSVPLVLITLALLEGALLFGVKARATRFFNAINAVVVVAIAGILVATAPSGRSLIAANLATLPSLSWIRTQTPCDARILADVQSEGAFEVLTGRVAILEGATPYLRPAVREMVVRLFLDAGKFFRRPKRHRAFLERQGVDYVILVGGAVIGQRDAIDKGNASKLSRVRFLRAVYDSPQMNVYRVVGLESSGRFPRPEAFPGYGCFRSPLEF